MGILIAALILLLIKITGTMEPRTWSYSGSIDLLNEKHGNVLMFRDTLVYEPNNMLLSTVELKALTTLSHEYIITVR